jgi:chemotaxis protein methyltransferase CheR
MKVIAYYKNQAKHILVLGDLKEEISQADFLFEITDVHSNLEILFIESFILPARIIEALAILKEQYSNETLKIYTTTDALSQYFFDLRIPNFQLHLSKPKRPQDDLEGLGNLSEEELKELLGGIYQRYGYDFRDYRLESLQPILSEIMFKEDLLDFDRFRTRVLRDPEFFEALFLKLSINVTSFFRYPDLFRVLREEVLPYLNSFPHLRIWSVGASTGEEAYSLAILLNELNILDKSIIYATDFNPLVLQKAQNGLYSLATYEQARQNYQKSGGLKQLEEYFQLNNYYARIEPLIQKKVVFFRHNLTTDEEFNEFHLIICKNVLIYFNSELQKSVIELFKHSLHRNGFLVLGRSENMLRNSRDFIKFKEGLNLFKLAAYRF